MTDRPRAVDLSSPLDLPSPRRRSDLVAVVKEVAFLVSPRWIDDVEARLDKEVAVLLPKRRDGHKQSPLDRQTDTPHRSMSRGRGGDSDPPLTFLEGGAYFPLGVERGTATEVVPYVAPRLGRIGVLGHRVQTYLQTRPEVMPTPIYFNCAGEVARSVVSFVRVRACLRGGLKNRIPVVDRRVVDVSDALREHHATTKPVLCTD
jgi:hypothetical protein